MGWLVFAALSVVGDEGSVELRLRLQEEPYPPFRFEPRTSTSDAERVRRSLDTILEAPFSAGRGSYFHAALEVPPLESAKPLEAGSVYARLRSTHARSNWHEGEGHSVNGENEIDGTYHEFASLLLSVSPLPGLEITGRAVFAGWDEHKDRFEIFNAEGEPVVRHEDRKIYGLGATSRHVNLSVFGVGAKLRVLDAETWGFDVALAGSAKIPFGRDRDLTHAGTTDVALAGLARVPVGRGAFHLQIGGTLPFGDQTLFTEEEDFEISPFVFAGLGFTWRVNDGLAVGVQVEGNTTAFREVDFLHRNPASAVLGIRTLWGPLVLETGLGAGFDWSSSYQWMGFLSIGLMF